jgi:putative SOS response-associated peptidase YedK
LRVCQCSTNTDGGHSGNRSGKAHLVAVGKSGDHERNVANSNKPKGNYEQAPPSPLGRKASADQRNQQHRQRRGNARSDRIITAPTYREPFQRRRCIVPATGWYEWQKVNAKTRRPFHFMPKATPFAFGGVYDVWQADGEARITSFAIVTTAAASSTVQYHDRMPLVLEEGQFEDWMRAPPEEAAAMMKPYAGKIDVWEVPSAVGKTSVTTTLN